MVAQAVSRTTRQSEHSSATNVAFQQGYEAPAGSTNPYAPGSWSHDQWAAGWSAGIAAEEAEILADDAAWEASREEDRYFVPAMFDPRWVG